jgi:multiple sugar transport system substrate-binding protein
MKNPNFLNQLSGLLKRIRPRPHKLTVLLFTVALGLSVTLYACQSSAQKEITLCFAVPESQDRKGEITDWKQLTEKFNNDNEGKIKIKLWGVSGGSSQLKDLYSRSFKNTDKDYDTNRECSENSKYDLIYTDIVWLPEFAKNLLPLDKDFKEGELQDFLKTEIDNGKYAPENNPHKTSSKLYRIPFRTDVGVLYYNKDLLGKEKVPTTFDELLTISKNKLTNPNPVDYGYLWPGEEEGLVAMFVEVLNEKHGFWIDKDNGKVRLGEPNAIKAVEFLRRTIKERISPPDKELKNEETAKEKFLAGKSVFLRSWPGVWAEAQNPENQDSEVQGRIGIAPVIGGKGCHGGWGLAIAKNIDKERQEAAIKAVKFLTSRESQLLFTLSHGSVPTRKDLFFDPLIVSRYSHYPELFKMVNKTVSRPRLARYERVSNILQKSLQKAFNTETKNNEVESIMKTASEDTKKCLNNETQCGN